MKSLWQRSGTLAFWLGYPLLWVYLRFSTRTRVLVHVDDDILVVQGWLGKGQWQLPGGGVHRGEPSLEAALRELKEETGLTMESDQLKLFYQGQHSQYGLRFKYDCYEARLKAKPAIKKQLLEITDIAWQPAKKLSKTTATQDTYQAVQVWLKGVNLL